ncbi:MAG: RDD family protein [Gammaproteobacteria bacterium]|nr:RDD family protein [Gammaproteobacteria bacterium]
MRTVFLCVTILLGVITFLVVLNTRNESRIYASINIRFFAACPVLVVMWAGVFALFPNEEQPLWHCLLMLIPILLFALYGAWFESSAERAGLSKRAFAIVVVNKNGKTLSFKQAWSRNFWKLLLLPLAPLSLYLAGRDARRQSLHDRMANTFVMWKDPRFDNKDQESGYKVEYK